MYRVKKRYLSQFVVRLGADVRGLMAIETAIVMPILLFLALGAFDVSRLVARQQELQSGASEAEGIALTANMGETSTITTVKNILKTSLGLTDDQVTVTMLYRCGIAATLVSSEASCESGAVVSTYMQITLVDRYDPFWSKFGVGSGFNFNVVRQVQVS